MQPYIGEIRMVGFSYAPVGWALCNGQLLAVNQNSALFSLLGTTFGGNGISTFGLPDLQGRMPLNVGNGVGLPPYVWGQSGGSPTASILASNLPSHTHPITPPVSNVNGTSSSPVSNFMAVAETTTNSRDTTATTKSYAAGSVSGQTAATYQSGPTGSNQPLSIEPPYLAVYFIIALQGIFPTRN